MPLPALPEQDGMAIISVPQLCRMKGVEGGGGGGHENCIFALGECTFACIAWEGKCGNRGVSEVGRNVLQVWCTVAFC